MSLLIRSLTEDIDRTCEILLEDPDLLLNRFLAFKKGLESILELSKAIREENEKNQAEEK